MILYESNIRISPPFLKWAGGKRWMIPELHRLVPEKYNTYIEPFLGGGAVFFGLRPQDAILSDVNKDLIGTYQAIKQDWRTVVRLLGKHQRRHSKEYYYEVRMKKYKTLSSRAAKFIYLNRTCWNGLYRVNLKGEFNVPIGTKTTVIQDTDNFKSLSDLLSNTEVMVSDFESQINRAQENDFVFIDPPYTVKHNKNGFIKYNEKLFSWQDQIRLRDAVFRASERGVKVLVMNASHDSIKEIYSGSFDTVNLSRLNCLSANPKYRGVYEELAIKCW